MRNSFEFEFMINTAPPGSNSVYDREKLFWYDKIPFLNHAGHRGAVDKELPARADKPGPTPRDAVSCFFISFFFFCLVSLFLTLFFLLAFFSLFLLLTLPVIHLDQYIFLSLNQEFYFGKGISKALDLHTGRAYDQIKTRSCQDMSLLWNSWILFNASWHHDKQHTVHHKLY